MSDKEIFQWYIVTTVGGKEQLVQENLWNKIRTFGFDDKVKDIKIIYETIETIDYFKPEEAPKRMQNTEKVKWETTKDSIGTVYKRTKIETKNKYPGYVFVNMVLIDELWFIIRNTQLVTGIVGSAGKNSKPTPIGDLEIEKLFNAGNELTNNSYNDSYEEDVKYSNSSKIDDEPKIVYEAHFIVGDRIKIKSGALFGTIGVVESINTLKGTTNIATEIMGQKQSVENIPFDDIEVLEE